MGFARLQAIATAIATIVVMASHLSVAHALIFDAGDDLKAHELSANDSLLPNGAWTYGTAPSSGVGVIPAIPDLEGFTQYETAQHTNAWNGVANLEGWTHNDVALTSILVVNTSDEPVAACCGFTIDPGKIFQHPYYSQSEWSVVRWTAPSDGTISIAAEWIQKGGQSPQRDVYHNGQALPGAFNFGTGDFNTSGLTVIAGDTIDFALGPTDFLFFGSTSTQFDATINLTGPGGSLAGDYNDNGSVDAADYTLWRDNLGEFITLSNENPSAITPGYVDDEDYDFWKANFGNVISGSGAGLTVPVPEPGLSLLLTTLLLVSHTFRVRIGGQSA